MTILEPIQSRIWLLLSLWSLGSAISCICVAGQQTPQPSVSQISINPRPIRLPIVDATDNRFLRLSTVEGVSQIKADYIVQDNAGFMWFGTRYGLYRYDGYTFKIFVRDAGNPNSLDGTAVRALFEDRDGVLWVACDQSLNKFDEKTETFTHYPIPLANHITQDSTGLLWIATHGGLYRLDPRSGQKQRYSNDPNDPSSLSSSDVIYAGEDKEGSFWVVTSRAMDEFDRKTGKIITHNVVQFAPWGFRFYVDRFGTFWIFHGAPNPLAVFDRKSKTLIPYAFPEHDPTVTGVSAISENADGELLLATHGLGLLKVDRERRRFVHYGNIPTDSESLPQDKLDAVFVDREGNIWVAPGRMGPAFLTAKAAFKKLPRVPGTNIEPFVAALYQDRQGVLWIGTPEALVRRDSNTGRVTAYRTSGPGVASDVIPICEDRSGNLWVGTWSHGLHRFDRQTGKFKTYRHNPADSYSLSSDTVMRLLVDHNGTLWVGTADGLDRFDAQTEHFVTYKLEPQSSVLILELIEDRDGKMWIGTESSGLRHFDPITGQQTIYEHNVNRPGTLSDNRVNSVHFDRSGTMWVGTQNGLDKLDPQTGMFSAITQRDGLPGNAVGCILEDSNGKLWMSTNNGVARFNPQSKEFTDFSTAEGLPGPNLTGWGACFQSPSGEMFFGGFNGGTSFFPDNAVDSAYTPPVVLTDFRLFGDPVQIGAHSPLRHSISYTTDLILPHDQNVFSIAFAGLSYASPATNRYRYRLEGLEPDWYEVGSDRRQAIYTTLPPGTYTFRVQAATRAGPWSEPGVAVRIEILPAWWNTRWFRALCLLVSLMFFWTLYRSYVRRLRQKFAIALEARISERTRIARELHDTLLQSFQGLMLRFQTVEEMLPARPIDAKNALEGALLRADQAIGEGRDAITDIRTPTLASHDLAKSMTALMTSLSKEFAEGNEGSATFRVLVEGAPRPVRPILQDEIHRIARESLRNAFRHAQARNIETEITYGESLRLRFRDDGKGVDPNVVERGGRSGHWGLPGIRERATQIGAQLQVWSELGAGTEVELNIPGSVAYEGSATRTGFHLFRKRTKQNREHRS
jgi:ligand-binding sensor domain-containing protein/signal transduction histidine kinase